MPELMRNNFISVDSFMVEQARRRVIQENGQLVTPVFEKSRYEETDNGDIQHLMNHSLECEDE